MISILVPTRNRVLKLKRMYESLHYSLSNINNVQLLLYIDNDDNQSIKFVENNKDRFTVTVDYIVGSRVSLGKACNTLFSKAKGDLIMAGADDIFFKTKNWDKLIIETYNKIKDQICLFSLNDLYQNPAKLATHPIISKKALDVMGYFLPEQIDCNYGDEWLTYIFKKIGRYNVCNHIVVEHLHWLNGKDSRDMTYIEGSANMKRHSVTAFNKLKPLRDESVNKLLKFIEKYEHTINGK